MITNKQLILHKINKQYNNNNNNQLILHKINNHNNNHKNNLIIIRIKRYTQT